MRVLCLCCGIVLVASTSAFAGGWEATDLGELPAGYASATPRAINDLGRVVGEFWRLGGDERGFLWENGEWTDLGTLGGTWSRVSGINNRGQVVGQSETTEIDECWEFDGYEYCLYLGHGFLWEDGVLTDVGVPGAWSELAAINDSGLLAGMHETDTGAVYAARWDRRLRPTIFGAFGGCQSSYASGINGRGQVVGGASTDEGSQAFVWSPVAGLSNLGTLGGDYSWATGISDNGIVTGVAETDLLISCETNDWGTWCTYEQHAFVWQEGVMTDLGTLGGPHSTGRGVNSQGLVVGEADSSEARCYGQGDYSYCVPVYHAFVWQDGAMIDLGSSGDYSAATGINNRGEIVGFSAGRPIIWRPVR